MTTPLKPAELAKLILATMAKRKESFREPSTGFFPKSLDTCAIEALEDAGNTADRAWAELIVLLLLMEENWHSARFWAIAQSKEPRT